MKLGLLGKRYSDVILSVDQIILGETNVILNKEYSLGGIYNILKAKLKGISCHMFPNGATYATIISERLGSRRTSVVESPKSSDYQTAVDEESIDWLHVAYVDDLNKTVPTINKPLSLDFCTTCPRKPYYNIIDRSEIVFDSRERKGLYDNIVTETPIILHDAVGCECIISGEVRRSSKTLFVDGLNVNGAGDIFAAIFIREYLQHGIESAVATTSKRTTELLAKEQK